MIVTENALTAPKRNYFKRVTRLAWLLPISAGCESVTAIALMSFNLRFASWVPLITEAAWLFASLIPVCYDDCFEVTGMAETKVREAVVIDAVRTPLGRRDGMLKDWHPVD